MLNVRDLSLLERMDRYLDELIEASRKLGPMYSENPSLVADITRKAKALRTVITSFQKSVDEQLQKGTPA